MTMSLFVSLALATASPAAMPAAHALRARLPGLTAEGIGGPRMQAEGFESVFPMETLSVRGYAEVFRKFSFKPVDSPVRERN